MSEVAPEIGQQWCPACGGSGLVFYCDDFQDCPRCGGEGVIDPDPFIDGWEEDKSHG